MRFEKSVKDTLHPERPLFPTQNLSNRIFAAKLQRRFDLRSNACSFTPSLADYCKIRVTLSDVASFVEQKGYLSAPQRPLLHPVSL
jgi:hypothetical protein